MTSDFCAALYCRALRYDKWYPEDGARMLFRNVDIHTPFTLHSVIMGL